MADRVTQLQDSVNELAEHFCNSVGVLQMPQQPGEQAAASENAKLFSSLIARKAKDIDALINSLPSADCSAEIQAENLKLLEKQNQDLSAKLERAVEHGEGLLKDIRHALHVIAKSQLESASYL
ncbi:mediator of RNA polymerase II transcription subunit 21-like [Corticium candelabrum]|uniref:mediator of RNA polymerase II transcription subunit 21-like n=1 Tax=Corticium candelabrum TaxID=121492 RepID=UPI002E26756B|nr:mediator of RNA polymerase II transcription subunit 21-like [Corticium candelabrum]